MKFSCPHCDQPLEAEEEWIGHSMDCPACGQAFAIAPPASATPAKPAVRAAVPTHVARAAQPRRPSPATPPSRRPGTFITPPKRRESSGFGKFLLFLIVLAAGGFGFAMFQLNESPQQVWQRIVSVSGKPAEPAPEATPAPQVAIAPVPQREPAPTAKPLPEPPPAPAPPTSPDPVAMPKVATAAPPAVSPIPTPVAPPAPKASFPTSGGQIAMTVSGKGQTLPSLAQRRVTLTGNAELHITGTGDPLAGSALNFTSPDAWLFLEKIPPSTVASTYLDRMWVNGAPASLQTNLRVVQYESGTVVIPHGPDFAAMTVFNGKALTGASLPLQCYVKYDDANLSVVKAAIGSFRLKRGYMATIAQQENGTGLSRNYVAQDHDLEVKALPPELDGKVHFVRVFPWRWVSKKGIAGGIWQNLKVSWYYDWNIGHDSSLDLEYVPIRQKRNWPSLQQDWKARGSTHLLGFNEPDHKDQANLTVDEAIAGWPELLGTGLRLGAPGVSDGGLSWLYEFIEKADAAGLRVDFVPVHYYRAVPNPGDERAAATQFYNFLKAIHDRVKRPLWVTEWNNGANWTKAPDPTYAQQKAAVEKMIEMLDKTPFVERYAFYNWVEDVRNVQRKDGSLTPAGEAYRDKVSPQSYLQAKP